MDVPRPNTDTPPTTIEEAQAIYPEAPWRSIKPTACGLGRMTFAVMEGDPRTGPVTVLAIIENGKAPKHVHPGGETITTHFGMLFDTDADGEDFVIFEDDTREYPAGSEHQPEAEFWVGVYSQPGGSTLVE